MTKKEQFLNLLNANSGEMNGNNLFHPILMHFAARFIGKTYADFASDYKVLVESNIRALEYFDLDIVGLISDPYRETTAFGAPYQYMQEGVPRCLKNIVESIDDVHNLKNPDVYKAERTADRIKGVAYYQQILKSQVPVYGWIEGPLAEACTLAGVSNMLVQLMIDPDFCNFLLDKCMVTAKEFAKAQIEAGCDMIGIGDAICSQIDAETYNLFVKHRHKELVDYIHSLGASVKIHICGDITHHLPSLHDLGADIIDIDWQVDFAEAHKILGNKVAICGNINPITIQDKTADEIEEITAKLVKQETGHKFILSGGCEITVGTPHTNLLAMRRASKTQ